tara:strand:- start:1664 stop:2089 length:426 start_codon:yes stop_codon:yes gene_type:complete
MVINKHPPTSLRKKPSRPDVDEYNNNEIVNSLLLFIKNDISNIDIQDKLDFVKSLLDLNTDFQLLIEFDYENTYTDLWKKIHKIKGSAMVLHLKPIVLLLEKFRDLPRVSSVWLLIWGDIYKAVKYINDNLRLTLSTVSLT